MSIYYYHIQTVTLQLESFLNSSLQAIFSLKDLGSVYLSNSPSSSLLLWKCFIFYFLKRDVFIFESVNTYLHLSVVVKRKGGCGVVGSNREEYFITDPA